MLLPFAMIKDITYMITHTPQYINNIFIWLEDTLAKYNIQSSFDLETSKNYVTERFGVIINVQLFFAY